MAAAVLHLLRLHIGVLFFISILGYGEGLGLDQVEKLQQELQELKTQINKGGSGGDMGSSDLGSRMERLETLMSVILLKYDIGELGDEQAVIKEHLLKRLQGLEEKMEWCFTDKNQQGSNMLNAQLEQLIRGYFKDFRPAANHSLTTIPTTHKDCLSAYKQGWTKSGVYRISPDGSTEVDVYCEQELDGGGWVVFQRREDGSVNFYRTWEEYKTGFGTLTGEFWAGNDNLHLFTKDQNQTLKIELRSPGGEFAYADYSRFWVDNESQKYKVHAMGFTGGNPPGNSFPNGYNFSTKDRDYDTHRTSCARLYYGGWWYSACHGSNLNGLYGNTTYAKGLSWRTWTGYHISMTGAKMMIRPRL